MSDLKIGDTLTADLPGWPPEVEVTVEAIEDGVVWVSTPDGEEWEL